MSYPLLYPILNIKQGEHIDERFLQDIMATIPQGFIQLRMKESTIHDVRAVAKKMLELLDSFDSKLIPVLNDFPELASELHFPFVHVGQEDDALTYIKTSFPHLKVGVSTHTIEQFALATESGADYVAFGPVFHTQSKDTGYASQYNLIDTIMLQKKCDVVFIGGITPELITKLPQEKGLHAAIISALPHFIREGKR